MSSGLVVGASAVYALVWHHSPAAHIPDVKQHKELAERKEDAYPRV
jgi:hypothetical protein